MIPVDVIKFGCFGLVVGFVLGLVAGLIDGNGIGVAFWSGAVGGGLGLISGTLVGSKE